MANAASMASSAPISVCAGWKKKHPDLYDTYVQREDGGRVEIEGAA